MALLLRGLIALAEVLSLDPFGGLQPSVTIVLGDLVPSSGFHRHQECRMYLHSSKILIHLKVNKLLKNIVIL